jgi:hypothetical protein
MTGIRIILDGDLTPDVVKSAVEELGFKLERESPATELSPLELLFRDADGHLVRFTQDPFIFVKYLDAGSDVPGGTVARLRLMLPYYSDDEILRNAHSEGQGVQERVDWLMSATALEHRVDRRELIDLVARRLKDDSSAVRMAALRAAGWLAWPEFKPLVQPLAKDSDAEIATFAGNILMGFDRA